MWLNRLLLSTYKVGFAGGVNRCFYEHLLRHTNDYERNTWLGHPIRQSLLDLQEIQETIWQLQPELLIETGTSWGGSALFYCHLFDLIGKGEVVSVDIVRMHDIGHPRATFLVGSSVDEQVVSAIEARVARTKGAVMVILDSDHSESHVFAELVAYARFVTEGSYCLVQDGVIDRLSFYRKSRPGPLPAISRFLAENRDFVVDASKCKRYLVTHHPSGWLKRVRSLHRA
jgi:cephalosporin hydroxylase